MSSILLRFEGKRAPICVQCLKNNGHSKTFLRNCCKPVTSSRDTSVNEVSTTGIVVVLYIRGVTEPLEGILASHNVKVAQKSF